ncbi:NapC/NirT family cytochrome c [Psychromonas aquimarina]|uniref:NapC/NirT family cytochrome c n=1 Tax=Psychromonas aquimarina TaxID=444919 RepID=UPI0004291F0C|nr:NapC/NirT family cytochrome c [Psychromonas aquimarina]
MPKDALNRKQKLWRLLKKPWLLGLPVGLFVLAAFMLVGAGSFQVMMKVTNANEFCYSCHIGMDTIVEEYQASVHFQKTENGEVRAGCADCHVPREFVDKLIVKTKATADIWYMITGKINMHNFEDERPRMAEHVWNDMVANDSRNCRYCHEESSLLSEERPQRARLNHKRLNSHGDTCIDCHYGIAHKRPEKAYTAEKKD